MSWKHTSRVHSLFWFGLMAEKLKSAPCEWRESTGWSDPMSHTNMREAQRPVKRLPDTLSAIADKQLSRFQTDSNRIEPKSRTN